MSSRKIRFSWHRRGRRNLGLELSAKKKGTAPAIQCDLDLTNSKYSFSPHVDCGAHSDVLVQPNAVVRAVPLLRSWWLVAGGPNGVVIGHAPYMDERKTMRSIYVLAVGSDLPRMPGTFIHRIK